jgi:hypothetical protein
VIYVGIDWGEKHRMAAVIAGYAPYRVEAPLCAAPYLKKDEMIRLAELEGIAAPRLYSYGFKHNNCGGGCVRAGQAQFKRLLDVMPERFAEWERQEEIMQNVIGSPVTILSRSVNGRKVPLSLTTLREISEMNPTLIDMNDTGTDCNCTSSWFAEDNS